MGRIMMTRIGKVLVCFFINRKGGGWMDKLVTVLLNCAVAVITEILKED